MFALAVDDIARPDGAVWAVAVLAHFLEGVPNRSERIAQFMREHRQKFGLAPVGFAQVFFDSLARGDVEDDTAHPDRLASRLIVGCPSRGIEPVRTAAGMENAVFGGVILALPHRFIEASAHSVAIARMDAFVEDIHAYGLLRTDPEERPATFGPNQLIGDKIPAPAPHARGLQGEGEHFPAFHQLAFSHLALGLLGRFVDGAGDAEGKPVQPRFQDVVRRPMAHRLHGRLLPEGAGDKNKRGIRAALAGDLQRQHAVVGGQEIVGQNRIRASLNPGEKLVFRGDSQDVRVHSLGGQNGGDEFDIKCAIFQMEKAERRHRGVRIGTACEGFPGAVH